MTVVTFAASAAAQASNATNPSLRGSAVASGEELLVNETHMGANSELLGVASGSDRCWIHTGCSTGAGYSHTGSMGPGWYCTDDVYCDASTRYDACAIHTNCHSGVKFEAGRWTCSDDNDGGIAGVTDGCYIHKGCSHAGYSSDNTASLGNGWYCLDGVYVDANTQFDRCLIHKRCGCGVVYKGIAWFCAC